MVWYSFVKTPLGSFIIGSVPEGVCYIGLSDSVKDLRIRCQKHLGEDEFTLAVTENQLAEKQILDYFNGNLKKFTFPVFHINTPFRKKALEEVSKIPYGETASYGEIARRMGKPSASRAVGSANATNPLPLVIPCHRVVAGDGSLGGYGGGLKMKKWLLDLEKANRQ